MNTESQNDRIINGLLKAGLDLQTPDDLAARLSVDVLIVAPHERARTDLWPAIWCLASVLERQLTGRIFIQTGLDEFPDGPIDLSERCVLVPDSFLFSGLSVVLGIPTERPDAIQGDTRGLQISYGELLAVDMDATPVGCFSLAGYLGFAALARAAGIPSFHEKWTRPTLDLPLESSPASIPGSLAVLGLGQVGQAFLALLYFLVRGRALRIHLVDKGSFEDPNRRTQLLVGGDPITWRDIPKVNYIAGLCRSWGWSVSEEQSTVDWGWKSPLGAEAVGFLGFDNMDARRMGVEGGFSRIIECGVGTDFLKPHISWHSLPPSRRMAGVFFYENESARITQETEFIRTLAETPGGCGKVTFEGIQATAPCLGAIAVAYAVMELAGIHSDRDEGGITGSAYVWSPLLPIDREIHQLREMD